MTATSINKPTPAEILKYLGVTMKQVADATGLCMEATRRAILGGTHSIHEDTARYIAESLGLTVGDLHWPSPLTNVGRPPLTGGKYDHREAEPVGELCEQHYLFKSKTGYCGQCAA